MELTYGPRGVRADFVNETQGGKSYRCERRARSVTLRRLEGGSKCIHTWIAALMILQIAPFLRLFFLFNRSGHRSAPLHCDLHHLWCQAHRTAWSSSQQPIRSRHAWLADFARVTCTPCSQPLPPPPDISVRVILTTKTRKHGWRT